MKAAAPLYVIRWTTRALPKRSYYIQGVNSEGRFYGSVRHFLATGERFSTVDGKLTTEELAEVVELADRIRSRAPESPPANSHYVGVLADGPISYAATNPDAIIFRASVGNIQLPSGVDFSRIIEIIEKHIPAD